MIIHDETNALGPIFLDTVMKVHFDMTLNFDLRIIYAFYSLWFGNVVVYIKVNLPRPINSEI